MWRMRGFVSWSQLCNALTLWKWSSRDIISARALVKWKVLLDSPYLTRSGLRIPSRCAQHMSSRLNNCSLLMSSISYFIILWRKAKSRKTLFENSTLWSRFTMQIPQWLSSICFITERYELWHVISLEKLQAEAPVQSQKEVTLSDSVQLCKHVRHEEDTETSLKDRSQEESSSEATEISKFISVPSLSWGIETVTIRKGLTRRTKDLMEQMSRRAGQATQCFDIDGKLYLPTSLAQRSRSIIQTGPGTIEFSDF